MCAVMLLNFVMLIILFVVFEF